MAVGAMVFWLPDTLLHALQAYVFGRIAGGVTKGVIGMILFFILPQIFLPIASVVAALRLAKFRDGKARQATISLFLLLGIWLSGPLFMTINATFTGGGFATPEGGHVVKFGTLFFPVFTFSMSAYDGTLFGLLLVTLLLILTATGLAGRLIRRF